MKPNYQTIVVGGGLAGFSAAVALKAAGNDVALVAKIVPGNDSRTTALFKP